MTANPPALTIFATPKPFRAHIDVIQRNAITSWTRLQPKVNVILFGGDSTADAVARELGIRHIPEVLCTKSGAPLLNDLFAKAEQEVDDGLLCYVNADIMLTGDFTAAAARVADRSPVMMIGRRWDTNIAEPWDFQDSDWQEKLRDYVRRHGRLQSAGAIDYFLFTKGLGRGLLPLALGRTLWDHWLVWNARKKGAAIVDASAVVTAVHQNHDYAHHPQGHEGVWRGEEAQENRRLIGDTSRMITIDDANYRMTANSIEPSYRHVFRTIAYGWRHPRAFAKRLALGLARPFSG